MFSLQISPIFKVTSDQTQVDYNDQPNIFILKNDRNLNPIHYATLINHRNL